MSPPAKAPESVFRIIAPGEADGFAVQRRVPGPDGGEAWRTESVVATQGEARDDIRFLRTHDREVLSLDRRTPIGFRLAGTKPETPHGTATGRTSYGLGVNRFEAAGGTAFHVTDKANLRIDEAHRSADGWYAHPVGIAAIVKAFPKQFTTWERFDAARTLAAAGPQPETGVPAP